MPIASKLLNVEVTEELRFNKHITKEICVKICDQDLQDIFINKVAVVRTMIEEFKNR